MINKFKLPFGFLRAKEMPGPGKLNIWISMLGFSLGCIALIISISILNGFEGKVKKKIISFEGDLRISGFRNFEKELEIIKYMNGISYAVPFKKRKGLIIAKNELKEMLTFKSIDFRYLKKFYNIDDDDKVKNDNIPRIIIGQVTAQKLSVKKGDLVKIISPLDQNLSFGIPKIKQCRISQVFHTKVLDFDNQIVFVPEEIGNSLFVRKKKPDGIDIRLGGLSSLDAKQQILDKFPYLNITSWKDTHHQLFEAMKLEKIGTFITLLLIILVACFNLVSCLLLIIVQKIKQFAILKVLGASDQVLKSLILKQSLLIGGISSLFGLGLGLLIVFVQNSLEIMKLPSDIYFVEVLPMEINFNDIFLINFVIVFMILIAAKIASNKIRKTNFLEAI
ncbi:MAG: FtsX-like permease family protein [bacterium TMED144]|nr:MAG: FtsX-like permease family protein [bacterium TMED144]